MESPGCPGGGGRWGGPLFPVASVELTCPGFQGAGISSGQAGTWACGAGGSRRSPWGEGRECGCSTPSAWKWLADRTPERICLKLCLTHFLIPSSRYRNLLGAVLPPIPAALRWHADIQPPAGLHRVAHYSGGPAGLRPFRLLPDCILSTLEKGSEVGVFEQKMDRGPRGPLRLSSSPALGFACLLLPSPVLMQEILLKSLNPGLQ